MLNPASVHGCQYGVMVSPLQHSRRAADVRSDSGRACSDSPLEDDEGAVAQGLHLQAAELGQHLHRGHPQARPLLLCKPQALVRHTSWMLLCLDTTSDLSVRWVGRQWSQLARAPDE